MASPAKILNVREGASAGDLRKAYKRLALETHPDKGGSKEEFQKVQNAYEKLSNVITQAKLKAVNPVVKFKPKFKPKPVEVATSYINPESPGSEEDDDDYSARMAKLREERGGKEKFVIRKQIVKGF